MTDRGRNRERKRQRKWQEAEKDEDKTGKWCWGGEESIRHAQGEMWQGERGERKTNSLSLSLSPTRGLEDFCCVDWICGTFLLMEMFCSVFVLVGHRRCQIPEAVVLTWTEMTFRSVPGGSEGDAIETALLRAEFMTMTERKLKRNDRNMSSVLSVLKLYACFHVFSSWTFCFCLCLFSFAALLWLLSLQTIFKTSAKSKV